MEKCTARHWQEMWIRIYLGNKTHKLPLSDSILKPAHCDGRVPLGGTYRPVFETCEFQDTRVKQSPRVQTKPWCSTTLSLAPT